MDFNLDSVLAFVSYLWNVIVNIPGMDYIITYIKNSYQNDPIRIILEGFLILYTVKYLKSKRRNKADEELSERVSCSF